MKDLNDKITGDTLPAIEWNEVPSELQNVIEKTGQTLSTLDLDQMGKAIAVYASGGDFYTDSGIADAYVLSAVGSKQTPPAYFNGMKVRFLPANTNTGPATVNAGTLGVKSLVRTDGAVLVAGDMQAGVPYSFQYDTVSGKFLFNGEGLPDATEVLKGKIEIATQAETDTGTDDTRAVTPKKLKASLPNANESVKGIIEIATQVETDTGTDDTRAITPLKLKALTLNSSESVKGRIEIATQAETNTGTDDTRAITPKKLRFGVAYSLGTNGYLALPSWLGGIIFNWGANAVGANASLNVNLPKTFTTSHLQAIGSYKTTGTGEVDPPGIVPNGVSSVTLTNSYSDTRTIAWLSIGY